MLPGVVEATSYKGCAGKYKNLLDVAHDGSRDFVSGYHTPGAQ